jgi:hypothetical protein
MKIINQILACCMVVAVMAVPSFATTMCVQNDNVAVILDPSTNGTDYSYDNNVGKWSTVFNWGTVSGISACLTSAYGKSMGGTVSQLSDNNERVIGGERNGKYCWCKMTHPAVSLWAFSYTYSSASECASYCANYCGSHVRNNSSLRAGLFGSVGAN